MFAGAPFAGAPFTGIYSIAYSLLGDAGSYSLVGQNATLTYHNNEIVAVSTGGGFKTKTKVKKTDKADVEKAVLEAIEKITGVSTPIVEESALKTKEVVKTDFTDKINEIVLQAEIDLLAKHIEEVKRFKKDAEINAEIDDEEAILFLL